MHYKMKKELTLGTPSVPARLVDEVSKKSLELLNRALPAECQVKTASDCWYVAVIAAGTLTMMFPPAVAVLVYCVFRAKKAEKGGGR